MYNNGRPQQAMTAAVRALVLAATFAAAGSASTHDDFLHRTIAGQGLHVVTGTATGEDDEVVREKDDAIISTEPPRRLDNRDTRYQKLRIHFDTSNLDSVDDEYYQSIVSTIKKDILPTVGETWTSALSVLPVESSLYFLDGTCGRDIKIPRQYDLDGHQGSDLIVFVGGFKMGDAGCTVDTRAFGSPCLLDAATDRPIVGALWFCLDRLVYDLQLQNVDKSIITQAANHEMGHVLAMASVLYPFFRDASTPTLEPRTPDRTAKQVTCWDGTVRTFLVPDSSTLKIDSSDDTDHTFSIVTPTVAQVVRNHFACQTLDGAPLENHNNMNSKDCFGDHWDEQLFHTELMGGTQAVENVLSPLTLALMEDSGWYKASYERAGISSFGHMAGCDFVEKDCIVDGGNVPQYSKGFFCNNTMFVRNGALKGFYECDASHTHAAQCDLADHAMFAAGFQTPPPEQEYQYFDNPMIGPVNYIQADYCPIVHENPINCKDPIGVETVEGETFGSDSLCYNAKFPSLFEGSTAPFATCMKSKCNEQSGKLEVFVKGSKFVCDFDFQQHSYPGLGSSDTFECPRLSVVCPHFMCPKNCHGKGVCKDQHRCECFDLSDKTPDCSNTPYYAYLGPEKMQELNKAFAAISDGTRRKYGTTAFIILSSLVAAATIAGLR